MKLTSNNVAKIKAGLATGIRQSSLAAEYGVSRSTVSDIATGRLYAKVPWPDGKPCPTKVGAKRKIADYDPTHERIMELEAEIVHLTEERNRERQRVKAGAKTAGLFKAIVKEMDCRIEPFKALPPVRKPKAKRAIIEHCALHISDCHADAVIRAEEVGGLEEFNFPIACARAERLVDSTIEWTQRTLAPAFRFPVLWVLVYGDLSSGMIHKACERSYFRNQFKNCLAIAQLHALMLRDLAPHFGQINAVYVSGNHGRTSPRKDYQGAQENFDYLIAEITRLHCRDLKNLSFLIGNSWSVNVKINGHGFSIAHGDDLHCTTALPWYAMQRRQKGLIALGTIAGIQPKYFVTGHFHTPGALADIQGEMLMNGAWVATDPYSYNALTAYKEPTQLLHGVHEKHGVSWRLPIKLKTEGESNGPKRYKITGIEEIMPPR